LFDFAGGRTTVIGGCIAVIAGLAIGVADDSVAAIGLEFALLSRCRTNITIFDFAIGGATVARLRVTVVALLTRIDLGISARIHGESARPARRWAGVANFDVAILIATVPASLIAVVASLVTFDAAVAAGYRRMANLVGRR